MIEVTGKQSPFFYNVSRLTPLTNVIMNGISAPTRLGYLSYEVGFFSFLFFENTFNTSSYREALINIGNA
jgi:hypothetical protein